MKTILVIGSTGRVGSLLVDRLAQKGYSVLAGSRIVKEKNTSTNVKFQVIDLLADVDTIAQSMQNVDAVYFVSGSLGKNLLQVDLHGAIKTMQAAERSGVKRYILLSSVFALQPERWNEAFLKDLTDYNIAKHYADLYLTTQTKLNYTILQPGVLKEEEGTGLITVDVKNPESNSISNVVDTLIAILEEEATSNKVVMMHDGNTTIKYALKTL